MAEAAKARSVKSSIARIAGLALVAVLMRGDAAALDFTEATAFVVDRIEGAALVADDCGHGMTRYGINAASHPGVDIEHLTRSKAFVMYRPYWTGINADGLPDEMRLAAYDLAVNAGVFRARRLIAQAHGDVAVLLRLREQFHAYLVRTRPALYGRWRGVWAKRDRLIALASLAAETQKEVRR